MKLILFFNLGNNLIQINTDEIGNTIYTKAIGNPRPEEVTFLDTIDETNFAPLKIKKNENKNHIASAKKSMIA